MNAGAYGGEMKDCIQTVTYLTEEGELKEFSNRKCEFSYRHSIFCDKKIIIYNKACVHGRYLCISYTISF